MEALLGLAAFSAACLSPRLPRFFEAEFQDGSGWLVLSHHRPPRAGTARNRTPFLGRDMEWGNSQHRSV